MLAMKILQSFDSNIYFATDRFVDANGDGVQDQTEEQRQAAAEGNPFAERSMADQEDDSGDGTVIEEVGLQDTESTPRQLFMSNFKPEFMLLNTAQQINDRFYLIYKQNIVGVDVYSTIEFEDVEITERAASGLDVRPFGISYGRREKRTLELLYKVQPDIDFIRPQEGELRNDIGIQNTVQGNEISYDSLSSIGSITQESITVSATAGSVTGLITEATEVIADAGGVTSRSRAIETTGISEEISYRVGGTTETVTTSGY